MRVRTLRETILENRINIIQRNFVLLLHLFLARLLFAFHKNNCTSLSNVVYINYLSLFSNLNSSPIKSNHKTTSNFCFISIRRSLELDVVLNIYIHSYLVEISGDLEWKIGIQIPTMNLNGN